METNNEEKIEDNKMYPKTHEECGCTRDEFLESLRYLHVLEIQMLQKQGKIEAECEFCGTKYIVEGEELDDLAKEIIKNSGCDTTSCGDCNGCSLPF